VNPAARRGQVRKTVLPQCSKEPWQGTMARNHDRNHGLPFACFRRPDSVLKGGGEILEKLVGKFFRSTIDQPLAKLGEFAADLRFHIIA